MIDALLDAFLDSIKLIPFLFITYLLMELLERKTSGRARGVIEKADKVGPLWGALIGVVPQCGFSAAASNLYAGRIITVGTLISIYLSTSDEMLPIFISSNVAIGTILKILATKAVLGMFWGFVLEVIFVKRNQKIKASMKNQELLEAKTEAEDSCECCKSNASVVGSAAMHTLKIFVYIAIFSFVINFVIQIVGEENLSHLFINTKVVGELIAGLMGLVPNCASSVVITELYLQGILNVGAMMSGLLVNAGVGLLVLFRANEHHLKENLAIVGMLYIIGVISGVLLELTGITF